MNTIKKTDKTKKNPVELIDNKVKGADGKEVVIRCKTNFEPTPRAMEEKNPNKAYNERCIVKFIKDTGEIKKGTEKTVHPLSAKKLIEAGKVSFVKMVKAEED